MKVENLKSASGNALANQFIIRDGHFVSFQSYDSKICTIDLYRGIITIYSKWNYSNTTRKHFYSFLNQELDINIKNKDVLNAFMSGQITTYFLFNSNRTLFRVIKG